MKYSNITAAFVVLVMGAGLAGCLGIGETSPDMVSGSSIPKSHRMAMPSPVHAMAATAMDPVYRENYSAPDDNPVHRASAAPVSTFSIDVDTGAYANVRRHLNQGQLPPADAVRVEELVNYFSYDYPTPNDRETPFQASTEVVPTPWNANTYLMRIGVKAYDIDRSERPAANLVFLLDVSGSMGRPDKLPLLKSAFKLLTEQLTENDRVSMVVYAGAAGVVLEPTAGDQKATIRAALERLNAGGSTNGGQGIRLAYAMAQQGFIEGGINRIILATDGDMNVGVSDFDSLLDMVEKQRQGGVSLTTLGFGQGNYNDHLLEQAANKGNGNHAYIDNLSEARKVLVEELSSTLFTVAKDVKIQVEFNPAQVAEYRLIGYENRMLREEDFTNDKVDAGEIGAGHTVTALYEIATAASDDMYTAVQNQTAREMQNDLVSQLTTALQAMYPVTINQAALAQ
ncbi:VWA domain-containing protein [Pseudomonadota bacterium]